VLAIANGMTAGPRIPDRSQPLTRLPARSWLIRDSFAVHCRSGILAHAESILQPSLGNHRELTFCPPSILSPPPVDTILLLLSLAAVP
jgi:hypothetical protein